MEADRYKPWS